MTEKRVAGSLHRSGKAVKFTTNLNLDDVVVGLQSLFSLEGDKD